MTISVREFTRKIYHHLKEAEYVVTKNGVPEYVVTIKRAVEDVSENHAPLFQMPSFTEYGCGCEKEEGMYLCKKHGRV